MEPCPNCGSKCLGLDVIYAQGACRFCQECMTKGPRVAVSVETLYADQISRATSAWNEWAETKGEQVDPLGQVIHN